MPWLLVSITLADVLAKMSCSSIIFCTSPWKSLQVGHARITKYVYLRKLPCSHNKFNDIKVDNRYTEIQGFKKACRRESRHKAHLSFYRIRINRLTAIKIWALRNKSLRHDK